jgi:hypothetical protein
MSALGHVWTAPSWQELSSRLQPWSVQPCVRPVRRQARALAIMPSADQVRSIARGASRATRLVAVAQDPGAGARTHAVVATAERRHYVAFRAGVRLVGLTCRERGLMRYKVKSIAALDVILDGLPDKMRVEVDRGIGVSAKSVGDLRKLTTWSGNLAITTPRERHPESVVRVSKANVASRVSPKP